MRAERVLRLKHCPIAGGTSIAADVFVNRDWRAIFDIDYEDVQWVPTGEWLDEERFLRYQREFPTSSINHLSLIHI